VATPAPASAQAGLDEGLARVEAGLNAAVSTDDAFLTEVTSHLSRAGGKRVRPAFTLAAASVASADGAHTAAAEEAVMGAVAVELVHLGSLYHDDVIDEAATRRTVESVNARWGNLTAILAGDFLLAKASEIAASLGTEVASLLAATIGRLCQGEVFELRTAFDTGRTEEAYLSAIRNKTAELFATACRIGGIVSGQSRPRIDALTAFGENYGMAFQVVDDVLDLIATEAVLGKPAGHDLVEGVYTLPVLRTLAAPNGERLRTMLGRPLDEHDLDAARTMVRSNGAVAASLDVAQTYAAAAVAALEPLGPSDAVSWLGSTASELFDRVAPHTS
jgi:heptaprenyl diphosphate synthase